VTAILKTTRRALSTKRLQLEKDPKIEGSGQEIHLINDSLKGYDRPGTPRAPSLAKGQSLASHDGEWEGPGALLIKEHDNGTERPAVATLKAHRNSFMREGRWVWKE